MGGRGRFSVSGLILGNVARVILPEWDNGAADGYGYTLLKDEVGRMDKNRWLILYKDEDDYLT